VTDQLDSHARFPRTLGELKSSGYQVLGVKEEIRKNALSKIAASETLFPGIHGYDETVIPQVENALLAGHDIVFLGERGQAKSRIIRRFQDLLDEYVPTLKGSEVNDNPFDPISRYGKDLVAELGDQAEIDWIHRSKRYTEKLATPDASVADLVGEVDPVRVAEGRYLSDELTIHYGLVPRTNRGIFVINELPDLAERIQVSLLNVLEERDVQIRGYTIRLPLDILLVVSANPEDYTSRGRIITPLKDRFGSQIRTHYPPDIETELKIVDQEAKLPELAGKRLGVPEYMREIVAEITHRARRSNSVSQVSGVSVRLSISNYELLVANALRRSLRTGEDEVVPRIVDLSALAASMAGKLEIEAFSDTQESRVIEQLIKEATLAVFRKRIRPDKFRQLLARFDEGLVVSVGDMTPAKEIIDALNPGPDVTRELSALGAGESPGALASALEFVLEGLHLTRRLNKSAAGKKIRYSKE
jgi:magnesium chelatase subunit I